MSPLVKFYLILGGITMSFSFGVAYPTIHIWFMTKVTKEIFALTGVIETGIMAISLSLLQREQVREWARNWFPLILFIDTLSFAILNAFGQININLRFIGMAIFSSFTLSFLLTAMNSMINRKINGDELTGFQTKLESYRLWSGLIGGVIAIVATFDITSALIIQTMGYIAFSFTDYYAYQRLRN